MLDTMPLRGNMIGTLDAALASKVIQSNNLQASMITEHIERELAYIHNYPYAICVNSCSIAWQILLRALNFITKNIYVSNISSLQSYLSLPRQDPNINLHVLDCESKLPSRTIKSYSDQRSLSILSHRFGLLDGTPPNDYQNFIEDASESVYNVQGYDVNKPSPIAAILSFESESILNCGNGGAILVEGKNLFKIIQGLVWSQNARLSELNASLILAQHINRDFMLEARKTVASMICGALVEFDFLELPINTSWNFNMFPILLDQNKIDLRTRNLILDNLREAGIEFELIRPLHRCHMIKREQGLSLDNYQHGEYLFQAGFVVGCSPLTTEEHVERLHNSIMGVV